MWLVRSGLSLAVISTLLAWTPTAFAADAGKLPLADTRVALIAGSSGAEAATVLDLAEAELFADGQLTLVERREIDRVLREWQLSGAGLVEAARAVRLGRLLGADVLAVVETEPQSFRTLGLVVFETATGCHLWDRALPEADPAASARQIAVDLRRAVQKRAALSGNRRAVCLRSVRNVDLPPNAASCGEGVARLLERLLSNSSDLLVVDRQRLELIQREIALGQLGAESPERRLLAALVTIDLELRRGTGDEVQAIATFHASDGKQIGQQRATAGYADAVSLARALGAPLAAALQTTSFPALANPDREAERFAGEALILYRGHQLERAVAEVDVALTLAPENATVLEAATQISFFAASEALEPGQFGFPARPVYVSQARVCESLRLAERGLDLAERMLNRDRERQAWLSFLEFYVERALLIEREHSDDTRRRLADLQRRYRRLSLELDAQARQTVQDPASFQQYTDRLGVLLRNVELFSPTAQAWAEDTAALLEAWLAQTERYRIGSTESLISNRIFAGVSNHAAQLDRIQRTGQWVLLPGDIERLGLVYRRMTRHPQPALRVLGWGNLLAAGMVTRQPLEDAALRAYRKFWDQAQTAIQAAGQPPSAAAAPAGANENTVVVNQPSQRRPDAQASPADIRLVCYYAALDAIETLPTSAQRRQQRLELLEFMLARGELVSGVAVAATAPQYTSYRYYAPHLDRTLGRRRATTAEPAEYGTLLDAAERVLQRLDRDELVALDGQAARSRCQLLETTQQMLLARPDLRRPTPAPWSRARRLLNVTDYPGLRAFSRVLVRDGVAWTVGIGNDDQFPRGFWELLAVDLDSGRQRSVGKLAHDRGPVPAAVPPYADNCQFDLAGDTAYVGSFYHGILVWPLSGAKPSWLQRGEHLAQAQQLPSNRVFSLAAQGDKLYASVGAFSEQGTFLVSIALADHSLHTINASRSNAAGTPLDDVDPPPLVILPMLSDPPRHRVLFVVSHPRSHGGLWEIDTRTERIRRLTAPDQYIHWMSGVRQGRVILALADEHVTRWQAVQCDLATDVEEAVYGAAPARQPARPLAREEITGQNAWKLSDWQAQPPYLQVGETWWMGWPFSRLTGGSGTGQLLPMLEDQSELLGRLAGQDREFNWRQMEPLAGGKVLVSDRHGLWVLEMPDAGSVERP